MAIIAIRDRLAQLADLDARRAAILKSLEERGLLTPELGDKVAAAATLAALEDVYLPDRPKRRTRAMVAREKGLEPLALSLLTQDPALAPLAEAQGFVDAEKGVADPEEALAGARDIIAETISEDADTRAALRRLFAAGHPGSKSSRPETGPSSRTTVDWRSRPQPPATHPGHARARRKASAPAAVPPRRGPPAGRWQKGESPAGLEVQKALTDGYKRLLGPSLETELRLRLKERAEEEAVRVFAENLRELLLASPLGQKRMLAVDPGYRTGCKLALLDAQGGLLHHDLIHLMSDRQREEASQKIAELVAAYQVQAVAIGNGTASRETEALSGLGLKRPVVVVSEAGASVYSASEVARREFPDLDLTVRGAVSIGRRLMDPLAELVKIDPKAIGVGQYQHDVDQNALQRSLEDVVVSCVNAVGVEVNTASPELLAHVSGWGRPGQEPRAHRRSMSLQDRPEFLKVSPGTQGLRAGRRLPAIRGGQSPGARRSIPVQPLVGPWPGIGLPGGGLCARGVAKQSARPLRSEQLPAHHHDILAELAKPAAIPASFEEFSFARGSLSWRTCAPACACRGW